MLKPLLLALQFLTRIPLPSLSQIEPRDVGRSLLWYPLVGLLIGALLFGLNLILNNATPLLHAALILAVWVGMTGALHLDGLADMADAWVGGQGDRERTLAIMKDPMAGPMGVTALVILLLIKFAALEHLLVHNAYLLFIVPVLGRTQLLWLFLTTPYVRREGLGEAMANELPAAAAWVVVAVTTLLIALTGHWELPLLALLTFLTFRYAIMRRLHGTTGDTAGALLEISEMVLLVGTTLL